MLHGAHTGKGGPGCYLLAIFPFALAGCAGPQSALDPGGEESRQIAALFWVMASAGALIWLGIVGLLIYALWPERRVHRDRTVGHLIFWGGAIFPSVALLLLLAYALWLMPGLRPFAQAEATVLRIEVTGKQFWWRVVYRPPGGSPVIDANEIRLPVGERVELTLKSEDVIHSFWIPGLGGKMDMIPGRTNRLSLVAERPGTFRGACAEYCGTSHALMAIAAVAVEKDAFEAWLAARAQPSAGTAAPGAGLFRHHGCGACHRVAGTQAQGRVGPDLSHVGSRITLGAGILPNTEAAMVRFITRPQEVKPGQHMPAFDMIAADDVRAIAAYLRALR
ncbi:MAG: cytochrome c oxidase subunit II [Parvibaculaceae bacterium]